MGGLAIRADMTVAQLTTLLDTVSQTAVVLPMKLREE